MKKILIFLLVLFCLIAARNTCAQNAKMHILLIDGSTKAFEIDSIALMTVDKHDTVPTYHVMDLFSKSGIPNPEVINTSFFDTLAFDHDPPTREVLVVREGRGMFDDEYGITNLDSVTFPNYETNTNVILLPQSYVDLVHVPSGDSLGGNYHSVAWFRNRIYCSSPERYYDLDSNYNLLHDSVIAESNTEWVGPWSLDVNEAGDKLLSVSSNGVYANGYAFGWLGEDRPLSGGFDILDSGDVVSIAKYYRNTDSIIFYSFGRDSNSILTSSGAGYYLFDCLTGNKSFLLPNISRFGADGSVNGFDISPDGKKLLIPFDGPVPLIAEYDLTTHKLDTLRVSFDGTHGRSLLWLRYNHDGSKILYGNYPQHAFDLSPFGVSDTSEIGILDRATLVKQILYTDQTNEGWWISVFPQWSPDEKSIVYCTAPIYTEPRGSVGNFQVCILKSLK